MKIYKISQNNPELDNLLNDLRGKFPGIDLYVSENDMRLFIHEIRLPEDMRNQGIGGSIIESLQAYARDRNKPIVLSPEAERGKKHALDDFYRSHGFNHNRGRNKDYSLSSFFGPTMVWRPK